MIERQYRTERAMFAADDLARMIGALKLTRSGGMLASSLIGQSGCVQIADAARAFGIYAPTAPERCWLAMAHWGFYSQQSLNRPPPPRDPWTSYLRRYGPPAWLHAVHTDASLVTLTSTATHREDE